MILLFISPAGNCQHHRNEGDQKKHLTNSIHCMAPDSLVVRETLLLSSGLFNPRSDTGHHLAPI
jgi:hypothetical protein